MNSAYSFCYEKEIDGIKCILEDLDDDRTVIMAPQIGNSNKDKFNTRLRVYSHGGRILYLQTQKQGKCTYLPDKGYVPDDYSGKIACPQKYSDIDRNCIEQAVVFAKKRANAESAVRNSKTYEERSVETALVYKNRHDGDADAVIIDMEFTCPEGWLGDVAKMRNGKKSKTGKPDLVIFDRVSKSFGIVELKVNNHSCGNMEKHFVDFTNMLKSPKADLIKREFARKAEYLSHYGIIEAVSEEDLKLAERNDLWATFLFVGGDKSESESKFENVKICECIDRKLFGFQHYKSLEKKLDYRKSAFFSK